VGVRNGDADARGIAMPAYLTAGLTWPQINDIASHVVSLSRPPADAASAARGVPLFAENCIACHGERGEGTKELGAPNLSDRIWLYGGDHASIARSIAYSRAGVMPPWSGRLDPAMVNIMTVYVHALGGGER